MYKHSRTNKLSATIRVCNSLCFALRCLTSSCLALLCFVIAPSMACHCGAAHSLKCCMHTLWPGVASAVTGPPGRSCTLHLLFLQAHCPGGQGKAYKPIACCVLRWACVCTGSPDVLRLPFQVHLPSGMEGQGIQALAMVVAVQTHPPPIPPPVAAPCMHWCVRATQRAGAVVGVGLVMPEVLCVALALIWHQLAGLAACFRTYTEGFFVNAPTPGI